MAGAYDEGAEPHDFPWAVSAGSLGDMEAGEEAQAADIGLPEPEAAAPEAEAKEEPKPLSPSSPGESGNGYGRLGSGTLSHPAPFHILACSFMRASPSGFPHL